MKKYYLSEFYATAQYIVFRALSYENLIKTTPVMVVH